MSLGSVPSVGNSTKVGPRRAEARFCGADISLVPLHLLPKSPASLAFQTVTCTPAGVKNTCLGWGLQSLPAGWGRPIYSLPSGDQKNLTAGIPIPALGAGGYTQPLGFPLPLSSSSFLPTASLLGWGLTSPARAHEAYLL